MFDFPWGGLQRNEKYLIPLRGGPGNENDLISLGGDFKEMKTI